MFYYICVMNFVVCDAMFANKVSRWWQRTEHDTTHGSRNHLRGYFFISRLFRLLNRMTHSFDEPSQTTIPNMGRMNEFTRTLCRYTSIDHYWYYYGHPLFDKTLDSNPSELLLCHLHHTPTITTRLHNSRQDCQARHSDRHLSDLLTILTTGSKRKGSSKCTGPSSSPCPCLRMNRRSSPKCPRRWHTTTAPTTSTSTVMRRILSKLDERLK